MVYNYLRAKVALHRRSQVNASLSLSLVGYFPLTSPSRTREILEA